MTTALTIDPKWIKNLQGREFCQYPGLLDLAHRMGLSSIATKVVQVPSNDNGMTCIVGATVTMADGKTFDGIGDASPTNVSKNIAPHLIRMAETRAKGRALRDATNVSLVAIEELSGDEADLKDKPKAQAAKAQTAKPISDLRAAQNRLRGLADDAVKAKKLGADQVDAALKALIHIRFQANSSNEVEPTKLWSLAKDIEADMGLLARAANGELKSA